MERKHKMDEIKVDKVTLIKTLRKNRKRHRALFLKAQDVYRIRMIEELDRALDEAKNGGVIRRAFSLPVPEDHTAEFDTVIQMLEWDKSKNVLLSHHEFRTYVENEWGWQQSFTANTEAYTSGKWSM
jgi:hypothetical protein